MKIGYMRVSTNDQSTDLQEDAIKKDGCNQKPLYKGLLLFQVVVGREVYPDSEAYREVPARRSKTQAGLLRSIEKPH